MMSKEEDSKPPSLLGRMFGPYWFWAKRTNGKSVCVVLLKNAEKVAEEYADIKVGEFISNQSSLTFSNHVPKHILDEYAAQQNSSLLEALKEIAAICDNENPTHETIWRIAYKSIQSSENQNNNQ